MKKTVIFLFVVAAFVGCRKEEQNQFDGPDLNDVYGEFKIIDSLSASTDQVSFAGDGSMHFNCELSKLSSWKLEIVGKSSGAKKIIQGTSRVLDENNATWDGSTTEFPIFSEEECDVTLSFEDQMDSLFTSTSVVTKKDIKGYMIADFETGWMSGWSKFVQSGTNMKFDIQSDSISPESSSYYNMQGEVSWDWLTGLVDFNADAYGEDVFPLTDNADNLYFNVLVYGEPQLPNSRILFRFDEDENLDGSFDEANEDQYGIEVIVDWAGWRQISIKYADLVGNDNGGGVHHPDRINKVSVLHLADPSSGFAKTAIDLMIFTENEELRP